MRLPIPSDSSRSDLRASEITTLVDVCFDAYRSGIKLLVNHSLSLERRNTQILPFLHCGNLASARHDFEGFVVEAEERRRSREVSSGSNNDSVPVGACRVDMALLNSASRRDLLGRKDRNQVLWICRDRVCRDREEDGGTRRG